MHKHHFRLTLLGLLGSFLVLWPSTGYSLPRAGSREPGMRAFRYLFAYSDVRAERMAIAAAKGGLKAAQGALESAEAEFAMDQQLLGQHAIAEEDYRGSKLHRDLSVVRVEQLKRTLESLEANLQADSLQQEAAAGKEHSLDELYQAYYNGWTAQCEKAKADVAAGRAQMEFAQYELAVTQKLQSTGADSLSHLLQAQAAYASASGDLLAAETWNDQCWTEIPSLEYIKSLDQH